MSDGPGRGDTDDTVPVGGGFDVAHLQAVQRRLFDGVDPLADRRLRHRGPRPAARDPAGRRAPHRPHHRDRRGLSLIAISGHGLIELFGTLQVS